MTNLIFKRVSAKSKAKREKREEKKNNPPEPNYCPVMHTCLPPWKVQHEASSAITEDSVCPLGGDACASYNALINHFYFLIIFMF